MVKLLAIFVILSSAYVQHKYTFSNKIKPGPYFVLPEAPKLKREQR